MKTALALLFIHVNWLLFAVSVVSAASLNPDDVLDVANLVPAGQYYEATVPDTLDLAERARAAINPMVNIINPDQHHYSWTNVVWREPIQLHALTWNLPCEYLFSLPLARTMCGSDQGVGVELGTMRSYLDGLADDGVIYCPIEDLGKPKGSCFPDNIGFVAFAMANWYERDGNAKWLDYLTTLCRGFEKMAIKVEDRAFYPPEYCYLPDGTWVPEGRGKLPPFDGNEPTSDKQGFEGAVKYYHAAPLQAFAKCYAYTGDPRSRQMAHRLKRFMLRPGFWQESAGESYDDVEKGMFTGHLHGNLIPLWALLNLALAEDDDALKQMVRSGYEHSRRYTTAGMGWSPTYINREDWSPHPYPFGDSCNIADSAVLAVKLSDAGLGDYWDDAESIARNQLAENQFMDKAKMQRFLGGDPESAKWADRFYGGFFQTEPTNLYPRRTPMMPGCCIGSGPWGLYFVWHGITRFDRGVATVNLFLNRASAWMDIDSYVPYEGKVVLRNKKAHTAIVRIPGWLAMDEVMFFVNDQPADPARLEHRVILNGLEAGDVIRLEFPIEERTEKVYMNGMSYTLTFRGPTLIEISPRNTEQDIFPTYEREHLKSKTAPTRTVQRFVAVKLIPLP